LALRVEMTEVVASGLGFAEGPRWRGGRLWFSDMHRRQVFTLDPDSGAVAEVVEVPGVPSGLGWDPAGRLLVVSMRDRRLLRLDGPASNGILAEVADLSGLAVGWCNDMVVDRAGRAYVGNSGFDITSHESPRPTALTLVEPDGTARVVADDLVCPNGMVITPDGGTLIVAETFGCRLTAFDIDHDGSLRTQRMWADLGDGRPDGIALDPDGGCWVAVLGSHDVLRVVEGGAVTDRIVAGQPAVACALDGEADWLYLCTCAGRMLETRDRRVGRIERARLPKSVDPS
jgi:YD repeat-containing protein